MDNNFKRRKDEKLFNYYKRITFNRKLYDMDYVEWGNAILGNENTYNSDNLRKSFYVINKMFKRIDDEEIDNIEDNDKIKEIKERTLDMQKEKYKVQTEKLELRELIREMSRNELYIEQMSNAIDNIEPLEIPSKKNYIDIVQDKEGILAISDIHYGREVEIRDLRGNIINKYDEKVFEERMWDLLYRTIDVIEKENLEKINIFMLGDMIDGILRVSQLKSLKYGIVDSVINFSEFMSNWLNTLSQYVNIEYYQCEGNHDEIRALTNKKGDFPNENVNRLIIHFIKLRLKDNESIIIHNENSVFSFANILDINVLGYHGEDKNLIKTLKNLQVLYKEDIDILLAGHLHSSSLQTVGISNYGDIECIRIPSICGIDDYAVKLQKSANAGAKMFIIEEEKGKTITYDFVLQ